MMKYKKIFTICILFLFTIILADEETCSQYDLSISSLNPNFGGISGFYSIGESIANGLQKTLSQEAIKDLHDAIMGKNNVEKSAIVKDLVLNQIGEIIFFFVGIAIALIAFLQCFFSCCIAICKCCNCCRSTKEESSRLLQTINLSGLVVCFSLILTAIILFNVSISQLNDSVYETPYYTDRITNDSSSVLENGVQQLTCTIDKYVNKSNEMIDSNINGFGPQFINFYMGAIGFNNITVQLQNISNSLENSIKDGNKTTGGEEECKRAVTNSSGILENIQKNVNDINTHVTNLTKNLDEFNKTINNQANEVDNEISNLQSQINGATDQLNVGVNNSISTIKNIMNAIDSGQNDVTESNLFKSIKLALIIVVTVLSCILLLCAFISFIAVLMKMNSKDVNSFVICLIDFGYYYSLLFCIFISLLSSVLFIAGWGVSAVCVPVLKDPNYRIFQLEPIIITIPNAPNSALNFTIGDVLKKCESPNMTLFEAINGESVLSVETIDKQLNFTSYKHEMENAINSSDYRISIPSDLTDQISKLNRSIQLMKKTCTSTEYSKYENDLTNCVKQLNDLITSIGYANNISNSAAIDFSDNYIDNTATQANSLVEDFMQDISANIFKCKGISQLYGNIGEITCSQFGQPIHGLWSSVGLIAVCSFLLAQMLLCAGGIARSTSVKRDNYSVKKYKNKEMKKNERKYQKTNSYSSHRSGFDDDDDEDWSTALPYNNEANEHAPRGLRRY